MPQSSTNSSFLQDAFANTTGVDNAFRQITVEVLLADPTLTSGEPRIWINTTTSLLKFSADGVVTKTVTAT